MAAEKEDFRDLEASMVKKLAKHVKKQGLDASRIQGWTAKVDGRDRYAFVSRSWRRASGGILQLRAARAEAFLTKKSPSTRAEAA